jgi:hypothetical protein
VPRSRRTDEFEEQLEALQDCGDSQSLPPKPPNAKWNLHLSSNPANTNVRFYLGRSITMDYAEYSSKPMTSDLRLSSIATWSVVFPVVYVTARETVT